MRKSQYSKFRAAGLSLLMACAGLCGCGTILKGYNYTMIKAGNSEAAPPIYLATQYDFVFTVAPWQMDSGNIFKGMYLLSPIGLVGLPLAIAVDTILLPVDLFLWSCVP